MNNVDALLETGRHLAMQMNNENPDLFQQIRRQMEDQVGPGGNPENPDSQDPQPPPPPGNN